MLSGCLNDLKWPIYAKQTSALELFKGSYLARDSLDRGIGVHLSKFVNAPEEPALPEVRRQEVLTSLLG